MRKIRDHEQGYELIDRLRDQGVFADKLAKLAPRYQEVIVFRFGLSWRTGVTVRQEMPLEQVAKLYLVTNERLRQIEITALSKLAETSEVELSS